VAVDVDKVTIDLPADEEANSSEADSQKADEDNTKLEELLKQKN